MSCKILLPSCLFEAFDLQEVDGWVLHGADQRFSADARGEGVLDCFYTIQEAGRGTSAVRWEIHLGTSQI